MRTIKKHAGTYSFTYKGRLFEVENMAVGSDGETTGWFVFEIYESGNREFDNDYDTKKFAIKRTLERIDQGII
jgi:phage protein U